MSEPRAHDSASDPARPLAGRTVVLGVSGGIAAYKAAELTRQLSDAGARVRVVMTPAAREFITPLTLQTLSGAPVATALFDLTQESEIGHIRLADDADLIVIAPATADLMARLAAGMADDLLATVVLATRARVLLAPAMNVNMWQNPLVQANVARLAAHGMLMVGPGAGFLACGWVGPGRMAEPAAVVEAARRALTAQDLAGQRVLITAGPTQEPMNPVRTIANRSSGKLGFALAQAAAQRGAQVTLVAGPVALPTPLGVTRVNVEDARQMHAAVLAEEAQADVVVKAAAVADYRVAAAAERKLAKEDVGAELSLQLIANPDILADLAGRRAARGGGRPLLVGFAAETPSSPDDLIVRARRKLERKGCDLVIANDVSATGTGFGGAETRVSIVSRDAVEALPLGAKDVVAHQIWTRLAERLGRGR